MVALEVSGEMLVECFDGRRTCLDAVQWIVRPFVATHEASVRIFTHVSSLNA